MPNPFTWPKWQINRCETAIPVKTPKPHSWFHIQQMLTVWWRNPVLSILQTRGIRTVLRCCTKWHEYSLVCTVPQKKALLCLIISHFIFPFLKTFLKALCSCSGSLWMQKALHRQCALCTHQIVLSSPQCWSCASHVTCKFKEQKC